MVGSKDVCFNHNRCHWADDILHQTLEQPILVEDSIELGLYCGIANWHAVIESVWKLWQVTSGVISKLLPSGVRFRLYSRLEDWQVSAVLSRSQMSALSHAHKLQIASNAMQLLHSTGKCIYMYICTSWLSASDWLQHIIHELYGPVCCECIELITSHSWSRCNHCLRSAIISYYIIRYIAPVLRFLYILLCRASQHSRNSTVHHWSVCWQPHPLQWHQSRTSLFCTAHLQQAQTDWVITSNDKQFEQTDLFLAHISAPWQSTQSCPCFSLPPCIHEPPWHLTA